MKDILTFLLLCLFIGLGAQQQQVSYSIEPTNFEENEPITIYIDGATLDESLWNITDHSVYLWSWSYDLQDDNAQDCPTNGTWTNSNETNRLDYDAVSDLYSISFVPAEFYNRTNIGRIGFLIKAKDGSGDKKSQDIYVEVGGFQLNAINPNENDIIEFNYGETINIQASTTLEAIWSVSSNDGLVFETDSPTTTLNYAYTPSESSLITIEATNPYTNTSLQYSFEVILIPTVSTSPIPTWAQPGINYNPNTNAVVLALHAPEKEYIHVIGSFNDWQVNDNYVMHRDSSDDTLFWIELSDLSSDQNYTFQYRTNDGVKIADPFSPIVLSPYDDQWIDNDDYPNLPPYPTDTDYEVSIIEMSSNDYDWNITDFSKPAKQDLIVYEVLLRDFTTDKNYQSLIDKIPYLKSLHINAIELMPIMEFDGNNSWGYNPSFHYALDKAYGTREKFKEFVDTAHANGIAVILDIALNHATGRSPLVRLWNEDPDGDGYGPVASNNPYFNQESLHSYGVFEDMDHSSSYTQYYVQRVIQHWIQEYKIDGFRWDLTKGFTQNCSSGDESCTNSYQQDRVDILKQYADYQWEVDDSSYVIFEHLGSAEEESQWANYRIDEGKGIMTWNNLNGPYNQNTMGYSENSNFNWVQHDLHGFQDMTALSYGGSHDEERLMFKNLAYGASTGSYNIQDLSTALDRQKAYGAVFLMIPGPKMIWQFDELGYEFGINRCEDGTYSNDCRTSPKPVAFELNYDQQEERLDVYETWSHLLSIRLANEVFDSETYEVNSGNLLPKIHIWDDDLPNTSLNNVIVVANFTTTNATIQPDFPYTGIWYDLEEETSLSVTTTSQSISLNPGEYKIYGNQLPNTLDTNLIDAENAIDFRILNNPVTDGNLIIEHSERDLTTFYIYDMQGKLVNKYINTSLDNNVVIPITQYPGLYTIIMQSGKQIKSRKVLVK